MPNPLRDSIDRPHDENDQTRQTKAAATERAPPHPKTPTLTRPTQPLKTTTPNRKPSPAHPAFSVPLKEGLTTELQSVGLFRVSHRVFSFPRNLLHAQEHRRRCVSRWMLHRLHRCLTRAREPARLVSSRKTGRVGNIGRSLEVSPATASISSSFTTRTKSTNRHNGKF